jgi:hypothetical protein
MYHKYKEYKNYGLAKSMLRFKSIVYYLLQLNKPDL